MPYKNPKDSFANKRLKRKAATEAAGFKFVDKPVIQCLTCGWLSYYNGGLRKRHKEGCPKLKS